MADFASALAAGIAACDELCLWQGQPTVTSRLQNTITQAQYDAAVAAKTAAETLAANRKTALTNVLADLDAADTADTAEGAANTAGDLARAAARAKIAAAP